jgi:hypothetical protein
MSFSRDCCALASLLFVSLAREIVTAAITCFTCVSLAYVHNSSTKMVLKGPFPVLYLRILCDPKLSVYPWEFNLIHFFCPGMRIQAAIKMRRCNPSQDARIKFKQRELLDCDCVVTCR